MDDFRPSVFTPFVRRFTDEKARDLKDTIALHGRVRGLHRASRVAGEDPETFAMRIMDQIADDVPETARGPFFGTIRDILALETPIFGFPEIPWRVAHLTLKEQVDLRHFLRAKEHFHTHEDKVLDILLDGLERIFGTFARMLPALADPSPFDIPLIYAVADPKSWLDRLLGELWKDRYKENGLFVELARALYFNLCGASGIVDPQDPKRPFKPPSASDEQLHDVVETYFKGTPFRDFLLAPVPLRFTHEDRFSHMHVVGGSNAGKTQLLQNLILHDLMSEEPPSLVVVDSQGDLIDKLLHLDLFAPGSPLGERLTFITPRDIKHPPALNVFALNRARFDQYDEEQKEQVVAGAIQTFDYLFSGLLGADLTAKQSVFFRFVARLMLALPETLGRTATILDILNLLEKPEDYREAIATLPPIQRNFFERDLLDPKKGTFRETREQIRYRLNAILENPTLARLFTAPETRIDLFDTLNRGGIIVVDTAKAFLKDASGHFGRIFISLTLQAILERAAIPEHKRRPTFLIVDEAANYFDSNIDDFLTEARKYKCGCVFAHQYLDQASWTLRASLAANTSIKFVSHVSTNDARVLAPDLRTTAEFILSQPKLHFAAHLRDITPNAVSIPIELCKLEREPRMDEASFKALLERNRRRVSLPGAASQATVAQLNRSVREATPSARAEEDGRTPTTSTEPKPDPTVPTEEW
jgi:hypothetical protein